MKNLSIIACVSSDRGLGKDNQLLWNIKSDMKFFRRTTSGHPVIMGKNTYLSIGHPLPNRQNIVLTRGDIKDDVTICHSKEDLDKLLGQINDEKFVIGGVSLYEMYVNDAEAIYLTEVDGQKPADVFFPEFDKTKYTRKIIEKGDQDGVHYEIVQYRRGGSQNDRR